MPNINSALYPNTGMATLHDIHMYHKGTGNDQMSKVVEMQSKTNDFWQVLPLKPCNDGTKEKALVRAALPDVAWRMINQGSTPAKSQVTQVSFTTGGLEALAQVDERILNLESDKSTYRMNENFAHQEAMSQKMATTFFYGDEKVNPAGFTGLSAFYYSKTNQDAVWGDQIIDAGGTGNALTSVWICTFSPDTVYGIYPSSLTGGYKYQDNGRQPVTDANGGKYYCYESQYNWDLGLAIRDPRYVVRLANVDPTALSSTTFVNKLIEAYNQIHNPDHGRTVILCNRKVQTMLSILASNKSNVNLRIDEFAGKKIEHFWTSPILRCDSILNTESQIV